MDKKKLFTKIVVGILLAMMKLPSIGTLAFYIMAL